MTSKKQLAVGLLSAVSAFGLVACHKAEDAVLHPNGVATGKAKLYGFTDPSGATYSENVAVVVTGVDARKGKKGHIAEICRSISLAIPKDGFDQSSQAAEAYLNNVRPDPLYKDSTRVVYDALAKGERNDLRGGQLNDDQCSPDIKTQYPKEYGEAFDQVKGYVVR